MRSMTGYGRGIARQDGREVTLELKSVNHRFLDLSFRLPRALNFVEPALRERLGRGLTRGHVDVSLSYQNNRQDAKSVEADLALALGYHRAARSIAEASDLANNLSVADLLALPDVARVSEAQEDEDALLSLIGSAAQEALEGLIASREREGEAIRGDLAFHLDSLKGLLTQMKALAPQQPENYRAKLLERLARLQADGIDPQRLAQEVALFADRVAIDEELARLSAHLEQMDALLREKEPSGRRMDFLVQEMNREVNTIGSKTSELAITRLVLDAKNAIEKMREQIQNAE